MMHRLRLAILVFCCCSCLTGTAEVRVPLLSADSLRSSVPETMRRSYIEYGERWLAKPWTVLPWTVFAENKINGNRVNYERLCFEKRRQLAALVMAEVMEGEGRFLGDIVNGLGSFCEETWWGIPAHYGKRIPLAETQEVDLFNAETASLIVWTSYMLRKQLDAFSPELCQRIDREIERRILKPALAKDYWWKRAGMNWNPWICSNWLACVLICEKDEGRRQQAIGQIVAATHAFIDAYPEDGGCDEGPGYWDRAAASMFEVLTLLDGEPDAVASFRGPALESKLRNMAAYAYKTYIGGDYCVNFADAHDNKTLLQVNILYPIGIYLNDPVMRQFAAYLGQRQNIAETPATCYDKSGNFPTLWRELLFLSHIRDFLHETPREPGETDVWLPNLQIMTARRGHYYVAMKGGHNDESHNHNDVGSFIVYADQEPLLIDVGVGEYTAKTFSKERYDIWTMQSQYHNLPQVNGTDQRNGKQYAARVVSHAPGRLTVDMAGAYPEPAAVSAWLRTVTASKRGITVCEDYTLEACQQPTRLMLMTTHKPRVVKAGVVELGNSGYGISYDAGQLVPDVENVSSLMDPLLQRVWGPELYRIVLTVKGEGKKNRIKYTIR